MAEATTLLTIEEKKTWKQRYYRYMDSFMKMCLADLPDSRIPILEFSDDDEAYTDGRRIHIGLAMFDAASDEEMVSTVSYILGHEIQHVRSTSDKAWKWGLEGGLRVVCEALSSKIEKRSRRFNKPGDYDEFFKVLESMGYKMNLKAMRKLVHYVMNSLEDGRIERIRSVRRPGFYNFMVSYRGAQWNRSPVQEVPFDQLGPRERLSVILNQVLTLSTMSIYQKGFTRLYAGTELETKVKTLMPNIAAAVASADCRHCMDEGIAICKALADDIAEAAKLTPLEDLLSQLIEHFSAKAIYGCKSKDEETDAASGQSPFGTSDIVIELEDEEFDKLEKQAKENGEPQGTGARIIFKRKNPKQENKENQTQNGQSTGNASPQDSGDTSEGQDGSNNGESKTDSSQTQLGQNASANAGTDAGNMNTNGNTDVENVNAQVELAMSEAAKNASSEVAAAQQGTAPTRRRKTEEQSDDSASPDPSGIAGDYDYTVNFDEKKRVYSADTQMPFELQGRADVFRRKVEKLFRNRTTPCIRGQKSGRIDVPNIYKLAMNEMDFFAKKGRVSEFDGCAYILADNSGSMGYGKNSKRYHCCNALAVIEEGFSKVMPLKIVAFDAQNKDHVTHEVIKNWHERSSCNFSYNFQAKGSSGNGNKDGYSIRIATHELLKQPGKKKMLIVLSDGLPSCYSGQDEGQQDVHDAVKTARANGIEVIGIYFSKERQTCKQNTEKFRKMYEKNCVITEPEMITDELTRLMKRFCFQ